MESRDVIIIGGGIAGMSAAGYAARSGRSTLLFEAMAPGGQCMYIDTVENYPGLTKPLQGFDFSSGFETQATRFGAEFSSARVTALRKEGDLFIVTTSGGEYRGKAVILATGAKHRPLGVRGEETYRGKGVSYCGTCDGPLFRGRRILVVGGGDTALSDALYLSKLTDKLTICHRKDRFRAQDALVERVKAVKGLSFRMESTVEEILGDGAKVTGVILRGVRSGERECLETDAVFIFVGMLPETNLLDESLLDSHGYVRTDRTMMTSLPGLFAAGDVRDTPFRQLVTAASDGAIAAHAASEYIDRIDGREYR